MRKQIAFGGQRLINWQTVLTSLVVSIIASLVTFTLGLKSGKNQADRAKLQELYKELCVHLHDIDERLDSAPRQWGQYETKELGGGRGLYLPPAKKMQESGNALYLKQGLFKKTLELEKDALNYGFHIGSFYEELFEKLSAQQPLNTPLTVSKISNRRDSIALSNRASQFSARARLFRLVSLLTLASTDLLVADIHRCIQSREDLVFEDDANPHRYSLQIAYDSIDDVDELAKWLLEIVHSCDTYKELATSRKSIHQRIQTLLPKLERRAREPHTFWDTFAGAFADVFHP